MCAKNFMTSNLTIRKNKKTSQNKLVEEYALLRPYIKKTEIV